MNAEPGNFRQLMEAISEGSEEAAWRLTETYSPHIMRAVRASLPTVIRSKVDSVDFLQSVWASMLLEPARLAKFNSPQQFVAYLAAAAKNKVIDKYRHFSTQKSDVHGEMRIAALERQSREGLTPREKGKVPLVSSDPSPSQFASVREAWRRVVDRSSPRDQEIIAMRMRGFAYAKIAASLSINEKTVQRTVSRVVTEFQQ